MPLTREDVTYYVRYLYRFLREDHTFEFRRHRGYYGWIFLETPDTPAHVSLDHRDKFLSTLIHEFIHHHHPEWSETRVLKMERKLINALSERQVRNLIKRFAEAL